MPSHLPATGSVWAVNDTANNTVTIARGLLEAATSDDISPAALLACSAFGSLLPISPEVRFKIEQLARRNHTSHVLNFIKAKIGYKKDDSVEQLSRSDSGIRFLCLVATLCTLDHYDAAERLDALLEATQQDSQIRPTIRQLQVMLNSMKTKMVLSDFATSVAGYEIMLRASLEGLGASYQFATAQIPTKQSLQELVLAMNQLGRIAEEGSIETIDVRLNSCYAPWTCAFAKWALGAPPHVRTVQGKILLQQDKVPVTLTILSRSPSSASNKRTAEGVPKLDVLPTQKIRGLRDILFMEPTSEQRSGWQGLVSARSWFNYQFSVLVHKVPQLRGDDQLWKAFRQAIFFIVAILPERLVLCDDFRALKSSMSRHDGSEEDLFHPTAAKAFLSRGVRVRIANDLVEGHMTLIEDDTDASGTLLPHKLTKILRAGCRQCQDPTNPIFGGMLPCKVHEVLEGISDLGSMLLTLTLFGPDPGAFPLLRAGSMFDTTAFHSRLYPIKRKQAISSTSFSKLIMIGWQALMHGQCAYLSCPPTAVFQHAAKMMGHQRIWNSTIISSLNGQALFPAFFEANDFLREGFLQLCVFPGKLQKGDMQFDFLLDAWCDKINTEGVSDSGTEEVSVSPEIEIDYDDVDRSESGNSGADDGQMEEIDLGDPREDHEEQITSEDDRRVDLAPTTASTTEAEVGRRANKLVAASLAGAKRGRYFSIEGMRWIISVRDQMLHGEMRLHDDGEMIVAWSLIESLTKARLSPGCPHPYNNPVGNLANSFEVAPNARIQGYDSLRSLIVAGQSYAEQLHALQAQDNYPPIVVHVDGCIQCAMQLGLAERVRIVIS